MKIIAYLFAFLLLAGIAGAASITQYNQTFADPDNSASNPWTAIASGPNSIQEVKGGNEVLVINTTVNAGQWGINLTIESGPYWGGAAGDKLYALAKNQTYILGPFDTSRFKQLNGSIMLTSNATRGKAICVGLP